MSSKLDNERIYESALRVFARYGFRRTRVEDIARELDVTPGTLYRYVKDKNDLYEKTVSFGIKRWQQKVIDTISGIGGTREKFTAMCLSAFDHLTGDEDMRRVMMDDPSIFPLSPRKVRFPEIDNRSLNLIKSLLQKGIDEKVFQPCNVDHVAELLYSIYVMFIIKAYVKSENSSTRTMFEEGVRLFIDGLENTQKAGSKSKAKSLK